MTLEELKNSWISRSDPTIQARMWDRAAADYRAKPLPDLKEDAFLKLLSESICLNAAVRTLDVGCGAGGYSLALAPCVGEAVGVDISGGMIGHARERAAEIGNARFDCLNWAEADIDALGFRKAFDVAFAHMTPAVSDYDTLEKLDACATKLCMVEKPTRRTDRVLDAALALVGIPGGSDDTGVQNTFQWLWLKGYEPQFYYNRETWHSLRSTEDMIGWCTDRAKLRKALTPEEEAAIRTYIENISAGGMVAEETATTRVTIIWKKE